MMHLYLFGAHISYIGGWKQQRNAWDLKFFDRDSPNSSNPVWNKEAIYAKT